MLIYESEELNLNKIIDCKDNAGFTPLYLLCEEGFRKNQTFTRDEEEYYEQMLVRKNSLGKGMPLSPSSLNTIPQKTPKNE
jgi:hypothetical protein